MKLLILFVVVPLVEIYLLVEVGGALGTEATILICVLTGIVGARLAKTQGISVMQRIQASVGEGRVPTRELIEGLMILVAGILLITPGLITDVVGILALLPPVRGALWIHLRRYVTLRTQSTVWVNGQPRPFERHDFDDEGPDQQVYPPGQSPKDPKSKRPKIINQDPE